MAAGADGVAVGVAGVAVGVAGAAAGEGGAGALEHSPESLSELRSPRLIITVDTIRRIMRRRILTTMDIQAITPAIIPTGTALIGIIIIGRIPISTMDGTARITVGDEIPVI